MQSATSVRAVSIFTIGYLLAGLVLAISGRNWEFVFYIVVVVGLGLVVLKIRRRAGFTSGLIWALSIWGLLHMIGGLVPVPDSWPIDGTKRVFYSWWIIPEYFKYDQPVHAYGFAVATWACWQGLRSATGCKPTAGPLTVCAFAGMGLGAVNEVIEFIATRFMDTNVGGYENVGWDLVYNAIGAITTVVLISRFGRRDVNNMRLDP